MTLTTRVSRLWRGTEPARTRHLWAAATTTTEDGVTAHVRVEFTQEASPEAPAPEVLDNNAMDAVEATLRQHVGGGPAAALPVAGDAVSWVDPHLVAGGVIGNVVVVVSDVEVTPELRRLVGEHPSP